MRCTVHFQGRLRPEISAILITPAVGSEKRLRLFQDQHEGNAYACHICHKGQSTKSAYGTHLWTTHAIKVAGIECWKCNHHECSFRAKTRDIVGHHITRIHLRIKPKPIECPFCQGQSDGPFTRYMTKVPFTKRYSGVSI